MNTVLDMTDTASSAGTRPANRHSEAFARHVEPGAGRQPSWLLAKRRAGLDRFLELGLPTTAHEDWRFTNLAPLAKLPFRPVTEPAADGVSAATLSRLTFAGLPGPRLVFVNGHFQRGLSSVGSLPPGVRIGSLAAALAGEPDRLERELGRQARCDTDALVALNTAFFSDGAHVHIDAGVTVEAPIQLIHVHTVREPGATIQPRHLLRVDSGARVTLLESHVGLGGGAYCVNAVTEMVVGDEAVVEHLKFQDESPEAFHLATLHGEFGRSSRVWLHSFALGGRLSRYNLRTLLAGDGLEAVLNGLYITRREQTADHHMIVEHARPHCASHEYFNGILDDRSKGVFHGRILVQPVAQKTDAKQTNKNILLSDEATVDTKPQLEIYADDVKCTHGATVGQLNDESIFYLRARGIGLERARRMLIHAFAGEITDRVQCEAAREELDRLVWDRLEESPLVAAG